MKQLIELSIISALFLTACDNTLVCDPDACTRLCISDRESNGQGTCLEDGSCQCSTKPVHNSQDKPVNEKCSLDSDCIDICKLPDSTQGVRCTDAGNCICPEAACKFDADCKDYCLAKTGKNQNSRCSDNGACQCPE